MDGITLGEIASWVGLIVGIIGGVGVIYKLIDSAFSKALKRELEPMSDKLDKLEKRHDLSDREHAKNYIVRFLADVEQGEPIDQDELHCFWDNYELYKSMGGNSYIHDKVEKLKAQGKL